MLGLFLKKALHEGTKLLSKFMVDCFTWGLMIRLCREGGGGVMGVGGGVGGRGRKSFINAFSGNMNTVNLKHFPDHCEKKT